MKQQTLAMAADQNSGFEQHRRPTRRDAFLATMEQIVPWSALCAVIAPHYPKPGKVILPANGGHPVKRILYATEVNHGKANKAEEVSAEALCA